MTTAEFNQINALLRGMVTDTIEAPAGSNVLTGDLEGATNEVHCTEHGTVMVSKISKKTGKPYLSHFEKDGDTWRTCFGKGWQ